MTKTNLDLTNDVESSKNHIQSLGKHIEELKSEKESLEEQYNIENETLKNSKENYTTMEQANKNLAKELQSYKEDIDILEKKINEVVGERDDIKSQQVQLLE